MPIKRIIRKNNIANDIMSSKLGEMMRNAIAKTVETGKSAQVSIPISIQQSNDDELIIDDVTIYRDCISCSREYVENKLQNGRCEICLFAELRDRIVLNDEENMNLAERVDYFNCECGELGIIMTPHIFKCLKNFYRIDANHVRFDLKNKMMVIRKGCENKPYDVY